MNRFIALPKNTNQKSVSIAMVNHLEHASLIQLLKHALRQIKQQPILEMIGIKDIITVTMTK